VHALDWAQKYLRKQCGLPAAPRTIVIELDPDDPANRLLTAEEAATAAHVDPATIRTWEHRGRITGVDTPHGKRYVELDVLQAEADTRRAPRERKLAEQAMAGLAESAQLDS
jgi:hypothetical protein